MMFLVPFDLLGNKLFRYSFAGAYELTGLLGVVILSFGIPFVQSLHGHLEIDFVERRLPKPVREGLAVFVALLGSVLFAVISWQMFGYGYTLQTRGVVSAMESIPLAIFAYGAAAGSVLAFWLYLLSLIRALQGGKGK
jgi:TRAP-type C4-dicarboxylate transport system permease small subunit